MSTDPMPVRRDSRDNPIEVSDRELLLARIKDLEETVTAADAEYSRLKAKERTAREASSKAYSKLNNLQVDLEAYRARLRDLLPPVFPPQNDTRET